MSPTEIAIGLTLTLLAGMYLVLASIMNWNFVFESRGVKMWVKIMGRKGTRILYFFCGLFLLILGIFILFLPAS